MKKKSLSGAKNVISDIRKAANSANYSEQFQTEEYYPEFRRIVVRNYKLIYDTDKINKEIIIIRVFDARCDPKKMNEND